ncbi:hypothetical protein CABS01_12100 [Colletotrichum abscissum]|uniref:uncharacterized protein n=1 Tax=Colletotrichum abscissum TaxID=1671311 RepID=UPI0027D60A7C|nr:uncharacterized protein CABS01_12100 [Colletotrichum abscissum]KAK1491776.1 hypothetical protein CABS01_12100 [Colletotrichum abscissum]
MSSRRTIFDAASWPRYHGKGVYLGQTACPSTNAAQRCPSSFVVPAYRTRDIHGHYLVSGVVIEEGMNQRIRMPRQDDPCDPVVDLPTSCLARLILSSLRGNRILRWPRLFTRPANLASSSNDRLLRRVVEGPRPPCISSQQARTQSFEARPLMDRWSNRWILDPTVRMAMESTCALAKVNSKSLA